MVEVRDLDLVGDEELPGPVDLRGGLDLRQVPGPPTQLRPETLCLHGLALHTGATQIKRGKGITGVIHALIGAGAGCGEHWLRAEQLLDRCSANSRPSPVGSFAASSARAEG